jgi:hypothetical protein
MAVIGALVLIFGFFLVTKVMGGKKSEEAPAVPANGPIAAGGEAAPASSTAPPPAGAAPASATTAPVPASSAPVTSGSVTVDPEALEPGPGMPPEFASAYERGDAVVLLIVKPSATDDKLVLSSVASLSEPGTSVFVVPADKIARFSRVTQGAGVTRVPALVVGRPRRVSGDVPEAEVSYGFRDSASVVQAVRDALYSGRDDLPYSPR